LNLGLMKFSVETYLKRFIEKLRFIEEGNRGNDFNCCNKKKKRTYTLLIAFFSSYVLNKYNSKCL